MHDGRTTQMGRRFGFRPGSRDLVRLYISRGGGPRRRSIRPLSDGSVDPHDLVMAFTFVAPRFSVGPQRPMVRFRTIDSSRQDAVVIDRADPRF